MKSGKQRGTIKGPFEIALLGGVLVIVGAVRFVMRRHFSWIDGLYCLVDIPVAILLLMVLDYTLHHARIAVLLVLALLLVLVVRSPTFCVGAGLAILIMVLTKWP